jgi:hypothetical protein
MRTILDVTVRFRSQLVQHSQVIFETTLFMVISRIWLVLQPLFTNLLHLLNF